MSTKFPSDLKEAREFQKSLAKEVVLEDSFVNIKIIGAMDVAYGGDKGYAAAVVYDIEKQQIIEKKTISDFVSTPYIPTFLFLREVPFFLKLVECLKNIPDLFLIDGHGIAHPYLAGSATIFGVIHNKPTIGIAKNPLRFFDLRSTEKDNVHMIIVKDMVVGIQYRPNRKWKPIYISPGNRISVQTAFDITKQISSSKQKLPYPLHIAHLTSLEAKKNF